MKKQKQSELKTIALFLKKLPRMLAEKAFLSFLAFFTVAVIIGIIVFYRYNVAFDQQPQESVKTALKFKSEEYEYVTGLWDKKQSQFSETNSKTYPNLFLR